MMRNAWKQTLCLLSLRRPSCGRAFWNICTSGRKAWPGYSLSLDWFRLFGCDKSCAQLSLKYPCSHLCWCPCAGNMAWLPIWLPLLPSPGCAAFSDTYLGLCFHCPSLFHCLLLAQLILEVEEFEHSLHPWRVQNASVREAFWCSQPKEQSCEE